MRKNHPKLKVTKVGLIISDKLPIVAASTDGIIKCKCHGRSILEIKCTFKFWDVMEWEESIKQKDYQCTTSLVKVS